MNDFVNLKIKSAQYFRCIYRDRMYICVFIKINTYTYMNIYIYTVFKKTEFNKITNTQLVKEENLGRAASSSLKTEQIIRESSLHGI
jgi:hypothetical protein